ncbi:MAG: type II toxin-antitoxin system VapC family toxin [Bacteroidetes bacterium]|nr:type II toxin-antitoxin system VapC family toxin [Bacteroidota bacterium]
MRYYVDTSVIGGYYDKEFKEWTVPLFNQAIEGKFQLIYSDITLQELENAPDKVKNLIDRIVPNENKELINSSEKSNILVDAYLKVGALNHKSYTDAEHIAVASVHAVDVIISWNFKHMVNYDRIQLYNKVNRRFGYPSIDILEPRFFVS